MQREIPFYKFDGAGNDFILIDARGEDYHLTEKQIAHLCHRRFGIGADGLMTLHEAGEGYDFEMRYHNSDGRLASMCGNGGRCITMFAKTIGVGAAGQTHFRFVGPDGDHSSDIMVWNSDANFGIVSLSMRDVEESGIKKYLLGVDRMLFAGNGFRVDDDGCITAWFLDTGSPHLVVRVTDLDRLDVPTFGKWLRHLPEFPDGTNVDFIEDGEDGILDVRTYERGVEDETLACGTGVTACAIVTGNQRVRTRGGDFRVSFDKEDGRYTDILLKGPVALNFRGIVKLDIE